MLTCIANVEDIVWGVHICVQMNWVSKGCPLTKILYYISRYMICTNTVQGGMKMQMWQITFHCGNLVNWAVSLNFLDALGTGIVEYK
jgi:hypothetical protein